MGGRMQSDSARKLKVFLCHAIEDKPAVRILYNDLVKDGFDAWLDEEKLLPGHDWNLEIHKAEREANAIIICLSEKSVQKEGYIQKEIKFALDIAEEKPEGTIYIIPARLEPCEVPSKLKDRQWVDLFTPKGYPKLRTALRARSKLLGLTTDTTESNELLVKGGEYEKTTNQSVESRESETKTLGETTEEIQRSPKITAQLFLFIMVAGLFYLDGSFIAQTLALMGLINQIPSVYDLNFGLIIVISTFASLFVAVIFLSESYGITKITGIRYRIGTVGMRISRIMAWTVFSTSIISWLLLGILGTGTILPLSSPLNKVRRGKPWVFDVIYISKICGDKNF
jgi:hypothetical protein